MYLAELVFTPIKTSKGFKEKMSTAVSSLMSSLMHNYQISESEETGWVDGALRVYTNVPRPDSLSMEYFSPWAQEGYDEVRKLCSTDPQFRILNDDVRKRFPRWQNSGSLVVDLFAEHSPIFGEKDREPVPPYLLPLDQKIKEELYFLQKTYERYYHIWISTTVLEIPVWKEMADPKSENSVKARELCRIIEEATNLPTYYFLARYWGRAKNEENRLCPLCGGEWFNRVRGINRKDIDICDFLCEKDRIISVIGPSINDERHARIGEYRKPLSRPQKRHENRQKS